MKRLALYTAIVLATLSVVTILVRFPEGLVLFLISLTIAATTRPMVDYLMKRGMVRGLAVVLSYLTILGCLVVLLLAISGPFVADLRELSNSFASNYEHIYTTWPLGTQLQKTIAAQLPSPDKLYAGIAGPEGTALAQTLLGITSSSFATISQFFGVLVLSIYWTIDRVHFERLWLSLLPVEIRARWRDIGREIEADLGSYIRSEIIQSVLAGLALGLGYWQLGIPYPALLAVFVALAWLLPWVGGFLAVIVAFLSGLSVSLGMGLLAAVVTGVVLGFMEFWVEPRLAKRRQYSPWLTVLAMMVFGDALGLVGVLIAPPVAAITQMAVRRIQTETPPILAVTPEIESARRIAALDNRLGEVREMVSKMEEKPSPQTTNLLNRLSGLVQEANEIITEQAGERAS